MYNPDEDDENSVDNPEGDYFDRVVANFLTAFLMAVIVPFLSWLGRFIRLNSRWEYIAAVIPSMATLTLIIVLCGQGLWCLCVGGALALLMVLVISFATVRYEKSDSFHAVVDAWIEED